MRDLKALVKLPEPLAAEEAKEEAQVEIQTFECEIENEMNASPWSLMPDKVEMQENPLIRDKKIGIKKEMTDTFSRYQMLSEENEEKIDEFIELIFDKQASQRPQTNSSVRQSIVPAEESVDPRLLKKSIQELDSRLASLMKVNA